MTEHDVAGSATLAVVQRGGHGCLVTALWFLFVGWWLSLLWIGVAWLLIVLVITMPLGLVMINRLPLIVSLREPSHEFITVTQGLSTRVVETDLPQLPFILRALYFLLIGIWLSLIWMLVAWALGLTLIGLPVSIWMLNRVPAITTLKRY